MMADGNEQAPATPAAVHQFAPVPQGPDRPFWSVMVPTYERVDLLVRALRSLMVQDAGPDQMQIQVVDNGSVKVDVLKIVREIAGDRIEYFRQEKNVGAFRNFETAIDRARGHWVHLLHDDDLIKPGLYSTVRAGVEKSPEAGMAVVGVTFIDSNDHEFGAMPDPCRTPGIVPDWLEQIAVMQRQQMIGTLVKRSAYEAVGGWRTDLGTACDWEMWIRIARRFAVWGTPQHLASFRLHEGSWTSDLVREAHNTRDTRIVIQAVHDDLPKEKADALTAAALAHYAVSGLGYAREFLQAGHLEGAINQLREALSCSTAPEIINAGRALASDFGTFLRALDQSAGDERRAKVQAARDALAKGWATFSSDRIPFAYVLGLGVVQRHLATTPGKMELV